MTQEQLEFTTFCIGNVAESLGVTEREAYRMLRETGLLSDYIVASYDVLHTYGSRYIADDLTQLLRERNAV